MKTCIAAFLLSAAVCAQIPEMVVPLHAGARDGGAPRDWACGPSYKVAFGEAAVFYPVLGTARPHNLPVAWRTVAVRVGGVPLSAGTRTDRQRAGDWRYEYRRGPVTEVYDARRDGVEQTFVLHAPPPGTGDLEIEGRIETALRAEPRPARHAPIVFRDETGTPIVSYGAAFAVDAAGRRTPMASAYEDGTIRLHLEGGWLRKAAFPVVVDPLLSNVFLYGRNGAPAASVHVARDDFANDLMVVYSRAVSASDWDAFAAIVEDDFSQPRAVFSDVGSGEAASRIDCAFVAAARKWIVVVQRDALVGINGVFASHIAYHLRDSGDYTLQSNAAQVTRLMGQTHRHPDVGGAVSGSHALVVFQSDVTQTQANTATSEAHAVVVDVVAGTATSPVRVSPQGASATRNRDREHPSLNQLADGTGSWLCVWQELDGNVAGDDWDVVGVRFRADLTRSAASHLVTSATAFHSVRPKVAGRGGRYAVLYGNEANTGSAVSEWTVQVGVQRFDWPESSAFALPAERRIVRSGGPATQYRVTDIAFDHDTDSHWAVVYDSRAGHVHVDRLGHALGIAESGAVWTSRGVSGSSPGVTFDGDNDRYPIVFTTSDPNHSVLGRLFTYPPAANVPYGSSCGSAVTAASALPHAGHEFYELRLIGAQPSSLALLAVSLAPRSLALTPFGLTGCTLNVDPGSSYLGTLIGVTDPGGRLSVPLPLPAPLSLDAFFQFFHASPRANPAGIAATGGLRAEIR